MRPNSFRDCADGHHPAAAAGRSAGFRIAPSCRPSWWSSWRLRTCRSRCCRCASRRASSPQPDGAQQLRVRVYPDQVHVDSHEPELTADERASGSHFWELTWRAADDMPRRQLAWQQLADRFDPQRAAWIARALRPLNPQDRPSTPLADGAPLSPVPAFPQDLPVQAAGGAWQRAPLARLMPQRWIAVARSGGGLVAAGLGTPIIGAAGARPRSDGHPTPLRATKPRSTPACAGWSISTRPSASAWRCAWTSARPPRRPVSTCCWCSASSSLDADAGAAALAALLDAHHYTNGCAFVPPGTPTNNTEDGRRAWTAPTRCAHAALRSEWQRLRRGARRRQQRARLAPRHWADRRSRCTSIGSLPHAARPRPARCTADGRSAVAADLGLLPGQPDRSRRHRPDTRARSTGRANTSSRTCVQFGPLPPLRVGRQPYGVLPVTLLGDWAPPRRRRSCVARDLRLRNLLLDLRDRLWRPRLPDVARGRPQRRPRCRPRRGAARRRRGRQLPHPPPVRRAIPAAPARLPRRGPRCAAAGSRPSDALTRPSARSCSRSASPGSRGWPARPTTTRERALAGVRVQCNGRCAGAELHRRAAGRAAAAAGRSAMRRRRRPQPRGRCCTCCCAMRCSSSTCRPPRGWSARTPERRSLAGAAMRDAELVNLMRRRARHHLAHAARPGRSPATERRDAGAVPRARLTQLRRRAGAAGRAARAALAHLGTLDADARCSGCSSARSTSLAPARRLDHLARHQRLGGDARASGQTGCASAPMAGWRSSSQRLPATRCPRRPARPARCSRCRAMPASSTRPRSRRRRPPRCCATPTSTHARSDAPNLFAIDLSSRRVRLAGATARRRAPGPAAGRAARLPLRARPARAPARRHIDDFRRIAPLVAATRRAAGGEPAESIAARNVVDGLELHRC